MAEFEHDAFDDVPVDARHRGAYRGETPEKFRGYRSLWATVLAGILALLLGGILFVNAPRLSAPASHSASASGPTASPSSASPSDTTDPTTTVAVYNAGGTTGAAGTKATELEKAGWTVTGNGNWAGAVPAESTVYYRSGSEQQARAIARAAGIAEVKGSDQYSVDVVVVLSDPATASPPA